MSVTAEVLVSDTDDTAATPDPADRNARLALVSFVAVEVAGLITYLVIGRRTWFFRDDWSFLAQRGLNVHDLFAAHGGHLVALPLAVYRGLFAVFGLRSYRPYQLLAIGAHLATAALLRAVIRRAGVGPWIATLVASLFVFFGAGAENILWGFQITFIGAMLFGFVQLLLADHDAGIDRRDWFGMGAGLLALLCSGVGVTMVAVAGTAALIRRGWRAATFHVVPLAAAYAVWLLRSGPRPTRWDASELLTWDRRAVTRTFGALAHFSLLGWLVALLLVTGLACAWRGCNLRAWRARASIPVATLAGVVIFVTLTGGFRAAGNPALATASRYLYVTAGLLLPAVAVAADALVRVRAWLAVPVVALLLAGLPGNISDARNFAEPIYDHTAYRRMMETLPRMPLAADVPRTLQPDPNQAPGVTVAWLLDVARDGKLSSPGALTPREVATNTLRLSLWQTRERPDPEASCRSFAGHFATLALRHGQSFVVRGTVGAQLLGPVPSAFVRFGVTLFAGIGPHRLTDVGGDLRLQIGPVSPHAMLCDLPSA